MSCRFLYTIPPNPIKATAAITPIAIPNFLAPLIPSFDSSSDSFSLITLFRLTSLASDGGGDGAGEEEGGGGGEVGDESGARSDGGGDGGELTGAFRGDASGGLDMLEGARGGGESTPVCGGGAGDSAGESAETETCIKSRTERTAQQNDATLAITFKKSSTKSR